MSHSPRIVGRRPLQPHQACVGCGVKWAQSRKKLCCRCQRAGLPGNPIDGRFKQFVMGEILQYPEGAYCVIRPEPPRASVKAFRPGHGVVTLEVVWNGT